MTNLAALTALLSQNKNSSSMVPWRFQIPTVTMLTANALPVGAMVPPLPSGIGLLNVPFITPMTAVRLSLASRRGWTRIAISGAHSAQDAMSAMCLSMPSV